MTTARSVIVDLDVTPYYHCVARCVRRAFLCGEDEVTGKCFDHRKTWVVERLKLLAALFAIEVCAYAVMSNHIHLVLRVLAQRVAEWSDDEVLRRAGELCPSCVVGLETWNAARRRQVVETWRGRLADISWFMGRLDEYIARRANKEDNCTGRFWEGRFKSQALMDEGALLTSMAYVDLNPVRAGIASGLDDSSWTSIQQRLREAVDGMGGEREADGPAHDETIAPAEDAAGPRSPASGPSETSSAGERSESAPTEPEPSQCPALAPLAGGPEDRDEALPLSLLAYIALLEWTGRAVHEDKRGHITAPPPELLTACGLDPGQWLESLERFGALGGFVGSPRRLKERASQLSRRWLKGQGGATLCYSEVA